jgi:hypothetical protein
MLFHSAVPHLLLTAESPQQASPLNFLQEGEIHSKLASSPGTVHFQAASVSSPDRLRINPFSLDARNVCDKLRTIPSCSACSAEWGSGFLVDSTDSDDVMKPRVRRDRSE